MEKSNVTPYATPDPEFNGLFSSDDLWYAGETNIRLTDVIDDKAEIDHTHTDYATVDHAHNGYATANHSHDSDYAAYSHNHDAKYAAYNHSHTNKADLVNGKVPISQIPNGLKEVRFANNIAERDAITDLFVGLTVIVVDATADPTVSNGAAWYVYTGYSWAKTAEAESMDVVLEWANIQGKPTVFTPDVHTHNEYATLSDIESLQNSVNNKADVDHIHTGFASQSDLELLEDVVDTKANTNHTHTEYSPINHSHNDYASTSHTHTASEIGAAASGHNHDDDYADINHNHNSVYATVGHNHDNDYASIDHSHDNVYYTETEIDTKLAEKSDVSHNHTGIYDANGAAANALTSANAYTDYKIDALVGEGASTTLDTIGEISSAIEDNQDTIDLLNAAIANKANVVDLTSHTGNTTVHITPFERNSWNAKSDFSGDYNDLTNKPAIPSISGLATETYVNEQIDAMVIPDALSDLAADSTHRTVTDAEKAAWDAKSNFSGNYNDLTNKPSIPSISGLATEIYVDEVASTKANSNHSHGDLYYTEAEVDSLLDNKSNLNHNHNSSYDALGAANTALASAKEYAQEYTDDAIANEVTARNSAISTAKSSAISTASSDATTKANNALASAKSYTDNAVATAKNDLLNGAGSAYDTLKELGDLIDENVDAIEALEAVAAGKANTSHTHTIANITNLQSTLDGKAAASHGTHVSYSTTTPVMDGSASVGTASTVARSDHKHPTDTSRAAQSSLDSHTSNKSNPHGVTLAQLGVTSTAAELNALDGITATVTELNYVDGATSNIQTQLNGKAASGHTHNYAGSSSAGGAATSANKLNTDAGSSTQPVYFANGIPVKTTYTLAKSVPADAKFTDTTYGVSTSSANGLMSASDKAKLDVMVLATVSEVENYLGI